MGLKLFKRLDRRLAADLKKQRKNIFAGLACVVFTSLLTSSTIWMVERSVSAIRDASPTTWAAADPKNPFAKGPEDKIVERISSATGADPNTVRRAYREASVPPRERSRDDALAYLGWVSLAIVAAYVIKYFFTRGQSYFLSKAANELATDLRRRLFAKIQRLPIAYFNDTRAGETQSILTNDVGVYQNAVGIIRDSIDGPVKAVTAFLTIVILQPMLSLFVVAMFPIMWWFIQRNGRKMHAAQAQVQQYLGELNAVTQEAIQGTRVIKAFSAEATVAEAYDRQIKKTLASQLRAARRVASLRPTVELIGAVALALVLYFCGFLAYHGSLQIPQIAALLLALDVINQGFRALGNVNNTYGMVQAASDRIYGRLLELPEEHAEAQGKAKLERPKGKIEFQDVSFCYPDGTEALKGVTFTLEPGTSLALVGPSGSGKSTIADLVLRFYDPTHGRILFDGVDLRELDTAWLREQIGVVPQQNFLFAGTIADNIRLGKPDATEAEIEEAAQMAHAEVFIDRLPERYNSELGERGIGLSGGEQQRIAIARALVRKPSLLLLDEATSALDAQSEQAVQSALDEVMRHRTTLFIAHRLTTAARADRIMVIRRGEVIEVGSHRELLENGGVYAGMYRAFSTGVIEDDLG